jgi:cytokinin dehydrogenase
VGAVDGSTQSITVGAGATLRRVVASLRGSDLLPPALPLNLDMTLGGLLSAGGLGPASHRHGPVIANVVGVDVVTGDGELRSCSRERHADLFHAVLGGMGQFGLVTQATLALRPAARRVRVFSFLYDDARSWLEDQLAASDADADLWIEGFCWAAARGMRSTAQGPHPFTHWMYGLHLAADSDTSAAVPVKNVLASLRAVRQLDEHEADIVPYLQRYEPRFAGMVESGAWNEPHPWFEAMVPVDRAEEVLLRILEFLPAEVGDGHRLMLVDARRSPEYFVHPAGRRSALIGVFPVALPRGALSRVMTCLEHLTSFALEAKGQRYLSGWLGSDPAAYLKAHFGEKFHSWSSIRRRYDPGGVLRSSLFPNGNRA